MTIEQSESESSSPEDLAITALIDAFTRNENHEDLSNLDSAKADIATLIKDHRGSPFKLLEKFRSFFPDLQQNNLAELPSFQTNKNFAAAFIVAELAKKATPEREPDQALIKSFDHFILTLKNAKNGNQVDNKHLLKAETDLMEALKSIPEASYGAFADIQPLMPMQESNGFPDTTFDSSMRAANLCLSKICQMPPVNAGMALRVIRPTVTSDGVSLAAGNASRKIPEEA